MTNSTADARQYAPATQRNREFILDVLQQVLPATGTVLEVSSGTGEHAIFFAPSLSPRRWLPSDPNPIARESVAAWQAHCPAANLYPPIHLDAADPIWSVEQIPLSNELCHPDFQLGDITAIVNINMIHIAPWSACLGLMAGAGRILPPDGILYLYGPYKQDGQHTASSNAMFDENLRSQNPEWGVRDLGDVVESAAAHNLAFVKTVAMPANNLSVVFRKR
jgi:SAM-dependent methyltransferase